MKYSSALVVTMFVSIGCNADSNKKASKENFTQAINGYFERNCVFVYPRYTNYPVTLELPPENPSELDKARDKTKTYEALTKVGMFDTQDGTKEKESLLSLNGEKYTVRTRTYSLSEQGKAALVEQTTRSSGLERGFCAATLEVNEIKNYSEPSPMMGMTVSKVNYSVSPKSVENWAKTEEILTAFPSLTRKISNNQDQSFGLILMNDGWIHEREM